MSTATQSPSSAMPSPSPDPVTRRREAAMQRRAFKKRVQDLPLGLANKIIDHLNVVPRSYLRTINSHYNAILGPATLTLDLDTVLIFEGHKIPSREVRKVQRRLGFNAMYCAKYGMFRVHEEGLVIGLSMNLPSVHRTIKNALGHLPPGLATLEHPKRCHHCDFYTAQTSTVQRRKRRDKAYVVAWLSS